MIINDHKQNCYWTLFELETNTNMPCLEFVVCASPQRELFKSTWQTSPCQQLAHPNITWLVESWFTSRGNLIFLFVSLLYCAMVAGCA